MSRLESEEILGGVIQYLQRCCREAEKRLKAEYAQATNYRIALADLREANARARDVGMYWRPAEETKELRRWVDRARELAATMEGALRLLEDGKDNEPKYDGFGVPV